MLRKAVLILGAMILLHLQLKAQEFEVRGVVTDLVTGEILVGATVKIEGKNKGVITDIEGKYTILVEDEKAVLVFSYIGYNEESVPVSGQQQIDMQLAPGVSLLSEMVVTAQAIGQRKAINEQLRSNTISNVISSERIREVPDANAAESIGRLPGVSVKRSSGEGDQLVVRGIQPNLNLVTINGIRMPSTDQNNNAVGLAGISQYMLESIEVRKSLTAQDDADVVGAIVDMRLASAEEGFHMNNIFEGTYNGLTNDYGSYRASVQASNRFFDNKIGIIAQINAERVDRTRERLSAGFGRDTRTEDNRGVFLQRGSFQLHEILRERYGGNIVVDYKLPDGKIMLNTIYNMFGEDRWERNYNIAVGNQTGITKDQMSVVSDNSTFVSGLKLETGLFDFANFDFGASYTVGHRNDPANNMLSMQYDRSIASPISAAFNENLYGKTAYQIIDNVNEEPANYLIRAITQNDYTFDQEEITLQSNLEIPLNVSNTLEGMIKFGGKMRFKERSYDANQLGGDVTGGDAKTVINAFAEALPGYAWLPRQYNDLVNASPLYQNNWNQHILNDEVYLTEFVSRYNVNQLLNTMVDRNFEDIGIFLINPESSQNDYYGEERLSAAYMMTEWTWNNKLFVNVGLRFEEEQTTYSGYGVKGELDRKLTQIVNLGPHTRVNQFLLPSTNIKFNFVKWADIRLAYSQSLARPEYYSFIPRYSRDFRRSMTSPAGNMNLKPALSENFDAILSFYNNYIGLFSMGAFYKEIKDFYYVRSFQVIDVEEDNLVHGYEDLEIAQSQYVNVWVNSPEVSSIRGAEFDLQTSFWYLPEPFSGLVLTTNFALMESRSQYYESRLEKEYYGSLPWEFNDVRVDTTLTRRLIDQPDYTFNMSLGYDLKGFSIRVAYNYQGVSMAWKGGRPEQDGFTHSFQRWDLSMNQKFPIDGLSMQLLVNNITGIPDRQYQFEPRYNTYEEFYGLTASVGLRYIF